MSKTAKPPVDVAAVSAELQALQRQRAVVMKSRIMQENRLQAIVAGTLDYSAGMEEKERLAKFKQARELIQDVLEGGEDCSVGSIIRVTSIGIEAFRDEQDKIEKAMKAEAKKLPVACWVEHKDQRGFGILFLAIVIGETGDLCNYANPAKVWKRLGCAPQSFNGKTLMGATWKSGKEGKLPGEVWEAFGYSPRRRSISYLVGEGLMKQNFIASTGWMGPYRARYNESRARLQELHPDYSLKRCHLHGMLLATKLLLKNLWLEWNHYPPIPGL